MSTYDTSLDALVIRELPSGEHDKQLTLLCADRGRIPVIAKGARSLKSRYFAASRAFVWGNFELHNKGDLAWLREATVNEPFAAMQNDIQKLYLAQYVADVAYELSGEGEPAGEILRLTLNTFHALCGGKYTEDKIKAVFEFRAAAISGYLPDLDSCIRCGQKDAEIFYLDVMNGGLVCPDCAAKSPPKTVSDGSAALSDEIPADEYGTRTIMLRVTRPALAALRYVVSAPPQRILAFELRDPADTAAFCAVCEKYLLNHLERGFPSLKLYHSLRKLS